MIPTDTETATPPLRTNAWTCVPTRTQHIITDAMAPGQEEKEGVCKCDPISAEGIQKDDGRVADNAGQCTCHDGAPEGTEPDLEQVDRTGDESCPYAEQGHDNACQNAGDKGIQKEERGIKPFKEMQDSLQAGRSQAATRHRLQRESPATGSLPDSVQEIALPREDHLKGEYGGSSCCYLRGYRVS